MVSHCSSDIIPAAGFSLLGVTFLPVPYPLSVWVQSIFATPGNGIADGCVEENLYPDAASSLTFAITPASTQVYYLHQNGVCRQQWSLNTRYIVVRFRPGAASSFLGLPMEANDNVPVNLSEIVCPALEDVCALADLLPTLNTEQQVTIVTRWLENLARRATIPDEKWRRFFDISQLLASSPEQWADVSGMSRRTLERHCKNRTGFSPHQLLSFARLHKVRSALINSAMPLIDIALNNGFYDQSHLTNTFRDLTTETPNQYRKRKLSQISNRCLR